jgi:nucleoside triphosphate pyrophosphatase
VTALVLASASASRARLLEAACVPFEIHPASVDEDRVKVSMQGAGGHAVADTLAELKAMQVSKARPGALVLGSDQVLVAGGGLMSKAGTRAAAAEQLRALRGGMHRLVTAAVLARDGAVVWRHVEEARLWMRRFSDAFLERYLAGESDAALGSVGCYRLEGPGAQLFERVEGDYFSILGLPLIPVLAALREQGALVA